MGSNFGSLSYIIALFKQKNLTKLVKPDNISPENRKNVGNVKLTVDIWNSVPAVLSRKKYASLYRPQVQLQCEHHRQNHGGLNLELEYYSKIMKDKH